MLLTIEIDASNDCLLDVIDCTEFAVNDNQPLKQIYVSSANDFDNDTFRNKQPDATNYYCLHDALHTNDSFGDGIDDSHVLLRYSMPGLVTTPIIMCGMKFLTHS